MLRERAKNLPEVTDEMWSKVNKEYVDLINEYIASQSHSPQTKNNISRCYVNLDGSFIIH